MKTLKSMNIEKVSKAIEADAGHPLPGLRESLAQAKAGVFAREHTVEQLMARKRGRPAGTTKADAKVAVKLRLDPDVLEALRSTGSGWQTRVNDMLHASLQLAGRL
ncbi:MAG: BrnA antitoxin family protein [Brachymonas sp.]|nr:BrnA antitoxin family protein [Brachymonas sp.]